MVDAIINTLLSLWFDGPIRHFRYKYRHKSIIERLKEGVPVIKRDRDRAQLWAYEMGMDSEIGILRVDRVIFKFNILITAAHEVLESKAEIDEQTNRRADEDEVPESKAKVDKLKLTDWQSWRQLYLLSRKAMHILDQQTNRRAHEDKVPESKAKVEKLSAWRRWRQLYLLSRKSMHIIMEIEAWRHSWLYITRQLNSSGMLFTKELIDVMRDDETITVGVVFGKNKTRMTSELVTVCEIAQEEGVFTELAIVYVSHGEDYLSKLQIDLAEILGLRLIFKEKKSLSERANLLRKRITCTGNILIILDNVSEKFDLEAVGIPTKEGDFNNGCKVVITSQEVGVCTEMAAQEIIHIQDFSGVGWANFSRAIGKWVRYAGATSIAKFLVDSQGGKRTEVEKLAEDVEAWIKEKGPIPARLNPQKDVEAWIKEKEPIPARVNPQMQVTENEHTINVD